MSAPDPVVWKMPEILTHEVKIAVIETVFKEVEVVKYMAPDGLLDAIVNGKDDPHVIIESIMDARDAAKGKSNDQLSQEIESAAKAAQPVWRER